MDDLRTRIADELSGWPLGSGYYQTTVSPEEAAGMADAVIHALGTATTHDRHRAAKAVQAVRATYVEDITRANQAIGDATDPDAVEVLRRARTILVGISAGLDRAAARLIEEES